MLPFAMLLKHLSAIITHVRSGRLERSPAFHLLFQSAVPSPSVFHQTWLVSMPLHLLPVALLHRYLLQFSNDIEIRHELAVRELF